MSPSSSNKELVEFEDVYLHQGEALPQADIEPFPSKFIEDHSHGRRSQFIAPHISFAQIKGTCFKRSKRGQVQQWMQRSTLIGALKFLYPPEIEHLISSQNSYLKANPPPMYGFQLGDCGHHQLRQAIPLHLAQPTYKIIEELGENLQLVLIEQGIQRPNYLSLWVYPRMGIMMSYPATPKPRRLGTCSVFNDKQQSWRPSKEIAKLGGTPWPCC